MKKLFIGNFDFEHNLGPYRGWEPPDTIRRVNAELSCVWMAIAVDGDYLWTPQHIEPTYFDEMVEQGLPRVQPVSHESEIREPVELIPWGWTDQIRKWADQQGWEYHAPPQAVVQG